MWKIISLITIKCTPARSATRGFLGRAARQIDWIERRRRCSIRHRPLWPLVRRRGGHTCYNALDRPCRRWARRSGGVDPRFAARQHDPKFTYGRTPEGSADARRRDRRGVPEAQARRVTRDNLFRWVGDQTSGVSPLHQCIKSDNRLHWNTPRKPIVKVAV